jgi:hypothetical protein
VIADPEERTIVSSMGWVDRGALLSIDVRSGRIRVAEIGNAKYLSLHRGSGVFFAALHHFAADRIEITAHAFDNSAAVLSRRIVTADSCRLEGDTAVWDNLPRHFVAYLAQPPWSDYTLVRVGPGDKISLQKFEWYDHRYDKDYQGLVGVTEIPGSHLVIVSVQRDSNLVIYDPLAERKVGSLHLSGNQGNPDLFFRHTAAELWAVDYDTVLKLVPGPWRIAKQRKLQGAMKGGAQFIGQFNFDADEKVCAVARPFSGDIVGLDPDTLKIRYRAELGKQPFEVAVLRDLRVFARDWKTGDLLTGTFHKV